MPTKNLKILFSLDIEYRIILIYTLSSDYFFTIIILKYTFKY